MAEEQRNVPFQYSSELEEFHRSFQERLRVHLDQKRGEIMPVENVQVYRHGSSWKASPSEDPSEMQSHQHGFTIKFEDLVGHNLDAMREVTDAVIEAMHASIMKMFYSAVSKVAESAGNTISVRATGSHAKAFLETLKKIEFGVDQNGKPSLPQFHASPEMVDALLADLRSRGSEFEREVEEIVRGKVAAAEMREKERRAKFAGV